MSAAAVRKSAGVREKLAGLPVCLVGALWAAPALAGDAEVTSDTAAQFYDVRSPTGQTILMRRRLTTTLGVGEYNMFDAKPGDPQAGEVNFRARMRYDADYGMSCAESTFPAANSGCGVPVTQGYGSFVPGLAQYGVDLMYAYLEGRRFFGGLFGFKLGRQYETDVLGWWSFDGVQANVTLPFYVKAEVYGGLEQRGGMPLSTARFEGDGIWRGSRSGFDPASYPSFEPTATAPAIGAAIESAGITWIHGRLSYRRVYNTGSASVSDYASGIFAPAIYDGTRISSDRLGYAVDASAGSLGGVKAGLVYDMYRSELTSAYASLDAYLGQKLTVGVDYDFYVPAFDADSIWNFFAGEPRNDFGLRGNLDLDRRLSVSANAHARMFSVQTSAFNPGAASYMPSINCGPGGPCGLATYYPSNGHPFDEGLGLSGRWRTGDTLLGAHGAGDFGDEGDRTGLDVYGEHTFETRYIASGRVGVWQWDDKLRPDRSATGFQYVASLGYKLWPLPRSQTSVEWEHDINAISGQRFRLMLLLSLGLTK